MKTCTTLYRKERDIHGVHGTREVITSNQRSLQPCSVLSSYNIWSISISLWSLLLNQNSISLSTIYLRIIWGMLKWYNSVPGVSAMKVGSKLSNSGNSDSNRRLSTRGRSTCLKLISWEKELLQHHRSLTKWGQSQVWIATWMIQRC